jgi:DNA-binding NarL/FixJ family response regulator
MKTQRRGDASTGTCKKIYIVDDHPLTRYGIAQLIGEESDLVVCGDTDNGHQAVKAVQALEPDLVLVDLTLPGKSGIELIRDLRVQNPNLLVLVLSMHDEKVYAERALKAGANGYLMKNAGGQKLIRAIRQVLAGETSISETVSARIVDAFTGRRASAGADSAVTQLTEREFQVFELLGTGLSTREIGVQLHISSKTVETHRLHIVEKLKLRNTSELTQFAIRWLRAQSMV